MNRLPKVLQNEIWEYVRGDRAYWKRQFKQTVLKVIIHINQELRKRVHDCRTRKKIFVQTFVGDMDIAIDLCYPTNLYQAYVIDRSRFVKEIKFWTGRGKVEFDEAVKLFYKHVEIEAILKDQSTNLIH
jgi:hypothetical protein